MKGRPIAHDFCKIPFFMFRFACQLGSQSCTGMIPLPSYDNWTKPFEGRKKNVMSDTPPPPPKKRVFMSNFTTLNSCNYVISKFHVSFGGWGGVDD